VPSASDALNNSIQCALPVLFRCIGFTSDTELYSTETVRISQAWLLVRSPHRLKLGSLLSLRWRVPTEVSGSHFSEMRGSGRVLSEYQLDDGGLAYKVSLKRSSK
jgi:hypothetical protein